MKVEIDLIMKEFYPSATQLDARCIIALVATTTFLNLKICSTLGSQKSDLFGYL